MGISSRISEMRKEIPKDAEIVGVVKTRTVEEIKEAILSGITIMGENRIQEAEKHIRGIDEAIKNKAEWHFIGRLQKNKVKKAVKIFSCIQSIDSVEIAEEINRRCKEENKKIDVFIEVNIGNEETKSGFFPNAEVIKESLMKIKDMEFINLKGMMVIEPFSENPENSRQYFINARELFDELKKEFAGLEALSMGMSNSYRIAIEEGSNMVRLGTAIFGKR